MRSVVVVLPASMWAMIPMLRTRSRPARVFSFVAISSPPVVRERLVCLGHAVHVVLPLPCAALLVHRVEDLAGQLLVHPLLAALPRVGDEVADRERARPALRHLDGNLVVRASDTAAARLEHGRDGLDRGLQDLQRRLARALADLVER